MDMVPLSLSGLTIVSVVLGVIVGLVAGMLSGMAIGGKALGDFKLAGMMGTMYASMPVLPGIILAGIVLVVW